MSNVPFLYSKTPDDWRSGQNSLSSSLTLKQLSLVQNSYESLNQVYCLTLSCFHFSAMNFVKNWSMLYVTYLHINEVFKSKSVESTD